MTLTEAYEELLRLHQQKGTVPHFSEFCRERYGTDRCMLTISSGRSVLQQYLSECQRVCLAEC